jgi:hypothetical protein
MIKQNYFVKKNSINPKFRSIYGFLMFSQYLLFFFFQICVLFDRLCLFAGAFLGTAITMPLTGWIIERWGWPMVFYVFGILGCVWSLLWWLLAASAPEEHWSIGMRDFVFCFPLYILLIYLYTFCFIPVVIDGGISPRRALINLCSGFVFVLF